MRKYNFTLLWHHRYKLIKFRVCTKYIFKTRPSVNSEQMPYTDLIMNFNVFVHVYISELTANIMSMGNLSCKLVRKVFVLFYISPMLLSELKAELF